MCRPQTGEPWSLPRRCTKIGAWPVSPRTAGTPERVSRSRSYDFGSMLTKLMAYGLEHELLVFDARLLLDCARCSCSRRRGKLERLIDAPWTPSRTSDAQEGPCLVTVRDRDGRKGRFLLRELRGRGVHKCWQYLSTCAGSRPLSGRYTYPTYQRGRRGQCQR